MVQTKTCIKKQRHHFADKGLYSQSYGFCSSYRGMWELDRKEGWVPKKWCFQIVVLQKTLESPWRAKRPNQSILREMNPEYTLEGLMLKLELQYFGHLIDVKSQLWKRPWCWKILRGGEGDSRGWDGWIASLIQLTWLGKLGEMVRDREAWCAKVHRVTKRWIRFSNWTSPTATTLITKRQPFFNVSVSSEPIF